MAMSRIQVIWMLLFTGWGALAGQVTEVPYTDTLRLPDAGDPTAYFSIIFDEVWTIHPQKAGLKRQVLDYRVMKNGQEVRDWPGAQYAGKIRYEVHLKDPQTGETGSLHASIAELVARHAVAARQYDMKEQLISVKLSERWTFDPDTRALARNVETLTPVIWQRRQTSEGEPLDDPDTGLPVYYRLELESIGIRNP